MSHNYEIKISIDYSKYVVKINCPELSLEHTSRLTKAIAGTLAIPTKMIAQEVMEELKEIEKAE